MSSYQSLKAIVIDYFSASRMVVRDCLTELGIDNKNILLSPTPERVLQLLPGSPQQYNLLFVSYRDENSRWDAYQLVEALSKKNFLAPGFAFILCADSLENGDVGSILDVKPDGVLLKPFTTRDVRDVVQRTLDKTLPATPIRRSVSQGSVEKGLQLVDAGLRRNPKSLLFNKTKGVILLREGFYEAATEHFRGVLARFGRGEDWAVLGLVESLFHQKRFAEAERLVASLIARGITLAQLWTWRARIAEAEQRFDDALEYYQQASPDTPGMIDRLSASGKLARTLGKHSVATRTLRHLVTETNGTIDDKAINRLQLARSHVDLAQSLEQQMQFEVKTRNSASPPLEARGSNAERELSQAKLVLHQIRQILEPADRRALQVVQARLSAARNDQRHAMEILKGLHKLEPDWFAETDDIADAMLDEAKVHDTLGNLEARDEILSEIRALPGLSPLHQMQSNRIDNKQSESQSAGQFNLQGMEAFRRGQWKEAYQAFENAYRQAPGEPSFCLNICQAGLQLIAEGDTSVDCLKLKDKLENLDPQAMTTSNATRYTAFSNQLDALLSDDTIT